MSSSQIHSPNSVRGRGSDGDTRVSSACTPGGGGTSGDCRQDVKLRNDTNNAMQCSLEPIQTGWRHHHCCDKHDRLLTLHSVWEVTWARKVTNKIHRLLSQENCRRINWSPPPSDAATDPGPSFPPVVAASPQLVWYCDNGSGERADTGGSELQWPVSRPGQTFVVSCQTCNFVSRRSGRGAVEI